MGTYIWVYTFALKYNFSVTFAQSRKLESAMQERRKAPFSDNEAQESATFAPRTARKRHFRATQDIGKRNVGNGKARRWKPCLLSQQSASSFGCCCMRGPLHCPPIYGVFTCRKNEISTFLTLLLSSTQHGGEGFDGASSLFAFKSSEKL